MEICAIDQELSENLEWFQPKVEREERHYNWYDPRPTLILRRINRVANADLASRFDALRIAWHREYGSSSSTTTITSGPSYRKIIDMGEQVLPLIFTDLERHRHDPPKWFVALREITKANPVSPRDRGNHRAMAKAWLKWAREKGHAP